MRKVTKEFLQKIFERLLQKLDDDGVVDIEIVEDLYRFVPTDEWSRYDKDVLLEGSLHDDFDSLSKLISEPGRYCTYVDFDRTATILRLISEKLSPVSKNPET